MHQRWKGGSVCRGQHLPSQPPRLQLSSGRSIRRRRQRALLQAPAHPRQALQNRIQTLLDALPHAQPLTAGHVATRNQLHKLESIYSKVSRWDLTGRTWAIRGRVRSVTVQWCARTRGRPRLIWVPLRHCRYIQSGSPLNTHRLSPCSERHWRPAAAGEQQIMLLHLWRTAR